MTASLTAFPPYMTRHETVYVQLTLKNGIARILAGEPEDQVICGSWVLTLKNAMQARRLIVLNPDGTIRRVLHAAYSHHVIESSTPQKRPMTRVWFDIADDHTAGHLIGQVSPICPPRNPVRYGKP